MAKTKVAVLGGGIGGLVAAYELSKTKKLQSMYEVTVYQMGWRLGGKGASGRNTSPEGFDRIEEHGLHIWLGNYQNAFLLMKECYDHCHARGLMPHSPFRQWQDAFKKHSLITMMEQTADGWAPWQILMPATDGWPGEAEQCLSLEQLIARAGELLQGVRDETPIHPTADMDISPLAHLDAACDVCAHMERQASRHKPIPKGEMEALDRHLHEFRNGYRTSKAAHITQSDVQRRRWILIDLATTLLRGVLEDVLLKGKESLAEIDDKDFRAWLAGHGAEPESIDSAPVRNTYEIVFGYRGGNEQQPSFAAGTAARFLLRWVGTYRGGFIYKMQAGMGDIVFTPLFLTLKDRGVKFRFFHKVLSLHLDAGKKNVDRIHMAEQVELAGTAEYTPLVNIKNVPSWPAAPLYDGQINPQHKAAIEKLKVDFPGLEPLESAYSPWQNHRTFDLELAKNDFHKIVLAIPLGALEGHCSELVNANPKFADMVKNVATVATQSFQLWLNRDQHQLGWKGSEPAILDSYRDSYADFSQLIPRESYPPGSVHHIGYFCKTLDDQAAVPGHGPNPSFERDEHERVKVWSRDTFLNGQDGMRPIWSNAYDATTGNFNWDWLTDQRGSPGSGPARFDAQFWCANVNPSDRYVQALAGTTQFRLKAGESGFENVVLAGDWVRTGVDAGCIEGATLGGMQAARAISGSPKKISGEDDFCQSGATGCLAALLAFLLPLVGFFTRIFGKLGGAKKAALTLAPGVKPAYVERGGEQVFPQPYVFHDCVLHGFVVDADYMALKALCDMHLNDPSHGSLDFWPAIGRVVVARLDVTRAQPENPMEYDYGHIREVDVSIFIPVVAFDGIIPVGMAAFAPYLFVDHPWGILGGREVYGLHKIPSMIAPMTFGASTLFGVDAYGVAATGLMAEVPQQLVLSVLSPPGGPAPSFAGAAFAHLMFAATTAAGIAEAVVAGEGVAIPQPPAMGEWTIREAGQAWDAIAKMIFGEALQIEILDRNAKVSIQNFLTGGVLPMVALKQFRDVANGRFACYQAVTESPAELVNFVGATIINDPLVLRVEDLVNHPLRADFGWPAGDLPITGAFQTQFSFKVGNGKELWRA